MQKPLDAFVMVDWSAANSPGKVGGQTNGIWVAQGVGDEPAQVAPFRTRCEAVQFLIEVLADLQAAGHRVLCGLDFAFGYPTGTATALGASKDGAAKDGAPDETAPWRWTWAMLADAIDDDGTNTNNRFAVAGQMNGAISEGPGPFWGTPTPTTQIPNLSPTKRAFPFATAAGHRLAQYRHTEQDLRTRGAQPKAVWQLTYAGSVGGQALMGIPYLEGIRSHPAIADRCVVWPFDTNFNGRGFDGTGFAEWSAAQIVLAEVYPSLLATDLSLHPVPDAAQVLGLVAAYRTLAAAGTLSDCFAAPEVSPEVLAAVLGEEGWILPVHA